MTADPLGLTPEQRTMSNLYASFRRREIWWPPEVNPRVIDGEWSDAELACTGCRRIGAHAPDCITLFAETLHDLGLELDMQLVPKALEAS